MTDFSAQYLPDEESALSDLEDLLSGESVRLGRQWSSPAYRSTEQFPGLNQFVGQAVHSMENGAPWSADQTWHLIEQVLQEVADDDFDQPELLAAKILLDLIKSPEWDDIVPTPGDTRAGSPVTLRELRTAAMSESSRAEFAINITLRRAYAAPLLVIGSTAPATFRKDRKNGPLRRVAKALLNELMVRQEGPATPLSDRTASLEVVPTHDSEALESASESIDQPVENLPIDENTEDSLATDEASQPKPATLEEATDENEITATKGRTARPRRKMLWSIPVVLGIAAVVFSVITLNQPKTLHERPFTGEDAAEIAGVPYVKPAEIEHWSYLDRLEAIGLEKCSKVLSPVPPEGAETARVSVWQDDSCLTSGLLVDPDEPFGVWAIYQNRTKESADNVSHWVELADGFEIIENTTYSSTTTSPNGMFFSGDIQAAGINLGNFAAEEYSVLTFQVRITDKSVACAAPDRNISVNTLSDLRRASGSERTWSHAYITCKE